MNELISFVIELLFAAVFVATFWTWLRHRDPLSRDVMLVFASLTGLFVVNGIEAVVGDLPRWIGIFSAALLLAQPLLVLRVCMRIGEVRGFVLLAALVAYAVSMVPLFVLSPIQPWMAMPAIGTFVATEGLAAWCLARAGLRRIGAARVRLLTAALATGLFALALLGLGLGTASEAIVDVSGAVARALGLLAAFGYAFAFLPIAWLQRVWRAAAGFEFTQGLIAAGGASSDEPWRRLVEAAVRITGATHAFVVTEDGRARSVLMASGAVADEDTLVADGARHELAAAARNAGERSQDAWPQIATALGLQSGHAVLAALVVESRPRGATLAWATPRPSLFARDDRELLQVLGDRAAIFAERSSMLRDQAMLNERLAATNVALERAGAAKSDFLASMSHELRTPLSAIIGFSSLMRSEPGDEESVSVPREWVEHVHSSGEHLLSLINDVLDLSKVEAGRLDLELERFDLSSAANELIGGMRPLADRKQIGLSLSMEPMDVTADRGRLRQILYNLVSNAIKFTPAGGRVSIESGRTDHEVRITVADTGVGIAPEHHERIFGEFQQVGDAASRRGGTGLGLALTRRLVEVHGGRMELESEPGRGSRFTVVLPDTAEVPDREESSFDHPAIIADDGEGGILVIEDDPSAVRLLRTYLEGAGHRVRVSGDGASGLKEARRLVPSAILLDILLPGKDGWEVLRELKADPRLRDVPVVVVTVMDERQLGLALGAVDYFLKPVDRDALLSRLGRYTFTTKVTQGTVRVLVIDDDPAARSMVSAALEPSGFDVLLAASGREGIERAREDGVHLVICDLIMPDLDGFEVVARLRADAATRELPILILTAHDLSEADKERLNGHIMGVVGKGEPSDVRDELLRWLARALAHTTAPA